MNNSYKEYFIQGSFTDNRLQVRFEQPISIPRNAKIELKMITYDFSPSTGYLNRGHSFSIDLPIKLNQVNGGTDRGFERKILVNVPPSEPPNLDTTDGLLPTTARRTYEPYQSIIHHLNNNEMSINEFSIIVSDMFSIAPPTDDIDTASIYFVIRL
tara:strand:+ start:3522 stop:3989 length:468 start_codon:yes stop_codon:yes gene_type:complete